MPPKQAEKIDVEQYLAEECPWLKQASGKWFSEFAKGIDILLQTHSPLADISKPLQNVADLLNENRAAIERGVDLILNFQTKPGKPESARFDANDKELKQYMFTLVSSAVVVGNAYHIDPVVYLSFLAKECPSSMKAFREQLNNPDTKGRGAYQLTHNCFPRLLMSGDVTKGERRSFQGYLDEYGPGGAVLEKAATDMLFPDKVTLHVNPVLNTVGATLTMLLIMKYHTTEAKPFTPKTLYKKGEEAITVLAHDYNGGADADGYAEGMVKRYDYFNEGLKGTEFSGGWKPEIKPGVYKKEVVEQ